MITDHCSLIIVLSSGRRPRIPTDSAAKTEPPMTRINADTTAQRAMIVKRRSTKHGCANIDPPACRGWGAEPAGVGRPRVPPPRCPGRRAIVCPGWGRAILAPCFNTGWAPTDLPSPSGAAEFVHRRRQINNHGSLVWKISTTDGLADGGRHAARIRAPRPARTGDRGPIAMCIRTRTASKISNPCPELLAARAGPSGRDGRVLRHKSTPVRGLVRKRAVGGGKVARLAADGGVISRTPKKSPPMPPKREILF